MKLSAIKKIKGKYFQVQNTVTFPFLDDPSPLPPLPVDPNTSMQTLHWCNEIEEVR